MNITTIGIDLAKNVFQVHGTDERGKAVLSKALRRSQMMPSGFLPSLTSTRTDKHHDADGSERVLET
jgi:hypothetical protein